MLIIKENPIHPETGSLYVQFRDNELGFLRVIPQCEMEEIRRGGEIKRRWEGCEDGS